MSERWVRVATAGVGLAAIAVYLAPGLLVPSAHWPMWDVHVYYWGGQQAAHGMALYAPHSRHSFTYPPFAALLFGLTTAAPEGFLAALITIASLAALVLLCRQALGASGVRQRPETVFAVAALALLTVPVSYTLHLAEVNLILAALVGIDLLRRDGGRWQGIATGVAAGIKLTPLFFIAYLLVTRRTRVALTATATFATTVAAGFILLPAQSRAYWLEGIFLNVNRIGDPTNPDNQSLSGAAARLAGNVATAQPWLMAADLTCALAGIMIAAWAHRRGDRLNGVTCCGITAVVVSPFSWTHHWIWVVPLLVTLTATAWRRRSLAHGLAIAAVVAVFSGIIPHIPPRHLLLPVRLLTGDLYVLSGLALLAATALALSRGSDGATRRDLMGRTWARARDDKCAPTRRKTKAITPSSHRKSQGAPGASRPRAKST